MSITRVVTNDSLAKSIARRRLLCLLCASMIVCCSCQHEPDNSGRRVHFQCRGVDGVLALELPVEKVVILFDDYQCNDDGIVGGVLLLSRGNRGEGSVTLCGATLTFKHEQGEVLWCVGDSRVDILEDVHRIRVSDQQWRLRDDGLVLRVSARATEEVIGDDKHRLVSSALRKHESVGD